MKRMINFDDLNKSKAPIKQFHDLTFECIQLSDNSYSIQFINDSKLLENCGFSVEVSLKDPRIFYDLVSKFDLPYLLASIKKSAADLLPWQHKFSIIQKDGTKIKVYGNAISKRMSDGTIMWTGFIMDLTFQKHNRPALLPQEFGYEDLFEMNSIMLIIDGDSGKILKANNSALKFYGYERREMLQMNISEINQISNMVPNIILQNIYQEKGHHFFATHQIANKEFRNVEVYATQIKFKGKNCHVSIVHDITNRIENEKKLSDLAIITLQSNIALKEFAYIASHDLKSPLNVLKNLFNLLYGGTIKLTDESRNECIKYARDTVNRMGELVEELLNFSTIGNSVIVFNEIDLNQKLKNVIHQLKYEKLIATASIVIHPLPVILGNKKLIFELFVNLISNAIKYNKSKFTEIEIGFKLKNNEHVFYVKDNGIGIKEKDLLKVFEMYKSLNNRKDYPGTGIGLALCKKIVEAHNGIIWVESEFKKGSVFYFTLNSHGISLLAA